MVYCEAKVDTEPAPIRRRDVSGTYQEGEEEAGASDTKHHYPKTPKVSVSKTPLSTNDLNIQFKGAPTPGSLAGCLGTLARDPEGAMPCAAACTDEMFICCL